MKRHLFELIPSLSALVNADAARKRRLTDYYRLLSRRGLLGLVALLLFAIVIPLLVRLGT